MAALGTDDKVTVYSSRADSGQCSNTGMAQMLAEELDADWAHVEVLPQLLDRSDSLTIWSTVGPLVGEIAYEDSDSVAATAARLETGRHVSRRTQSAPS